MISLSVSTITVLILSFLLDKESNFVSKDSISFNKISSLLFSGEHLIVKYTLTNIVAIIVINMIINVLFFHNQSPVSKSSGNVSFKSLTISL